MIRDAIEASLRRLKTIMSSSAKNIRAERSMDKQDSGIQAQVGRLQSDMTEVKSDIRRVDGKIDRLREDMDGLRGEMKDGFLAVHEKISQVAGKLIWAGVGACAFLLVVFGSGVAFVTARSDAVHRDLLARSDAVHRDLLARSDDLRREMTAENGALQQASLERYERLDRRITELQTFLQSPKAAR